MDLSKINYKNIFIFSILFYFSNACYNVCIKCVNKNTQIRNFLAADYKEHNCRRNSIGISSVSCKGVCSWLVDLKYDNRQSPGHVHDIIIDEVTFKRNCIPYYISSFVKWKYKDSIYQVTCRFVCDRNQCENTDAIQICNAEQNLIPTCETCRTEYNEAGQIDYDTCANRKIENIVCFSKCFVTSYMQRNRKITYEKGCIEHVNGIDLNINAGILNIQGIWKYRLCKAQVLSTCNRLEYFSDDINFRDTEQEYIIKEFTKQPRSMICMSCLSVRYKNQYTTSCDEGIVKSRFNVIVCNTLCFSSVYHSEDSIVTIRGCEFKRIRYKELINVNLTKDFHESKCKYCITCKPRTEACNIDNFQRLNELIINKRKSTTSQPFKMYEILKHKESKSIKKNNSTSHYNNKMKFNKLQVKSYRDLTSKMKMPIGNELTRNHVLRCFDSCTFSDIDIAKLEKHHKAFMDKSREDGNDLLILKRKMMIYEMSKRKSIDYSKFAHPIIKDSEEYYRLLEKEKEFDRKIDNKEDNIIRWDSDESLNRKFKETRATGEARIKKYIRQRKRMPKHHWQQSRPRINPVIVHGMKNRLYMMLPETEITKPVNGRYFTTRFISPGYRRVQADMSMLAATVLLILYFSGVFKSQQPSVDDKEFEYYLFDEEKVEIIEKKATNTIASIAVTPANITSTSMINETTSMSGNDFDIIIPSLDINEEDTKFKIFNQTVQITNITKDNTDFVLDDDDNDYLYTLLTISVSILLLMYVLYEVYAVFIKKANANQIISSFSTKTYKTTSNDVNNGNNSSPNTSLTTSFGTIKESGFIKSIPNNESVNKIEL